MKFGKLKSSEKDRATSALANSICAAHVRLHNGERVEGVVAGAAISNEIRKVMEKRDEIRREVSVMSNFSK